RGKLLDEYTETLGYNRDYLAHVLSNWGTTRYIRAGGKTVKIIATPTSQHGRKALKTASTGPKQGRRPKYQGSLPATYKGYFCFSDMVKDNNEYGEVWKVAGGYAIKITLIDSKGNQSVPIASNTFNITN
ncbi:MAG: hypothetical protein LBK74_04900, partial [Treponema sp.]|nr:hypothetical protein [Treponema sp.]